MNRQTKRFGCKGGVWLLVVCVLTTAAVGCIPGTPPKEQEPPEQHGEAGIRTIGAVPTEYRLEEELGRTEIREVARGLMSDLLDGLSVEEDGRDFVLDEWKDLSLEIDHMYGIWVVSGEVDVLYHGVLSPVGDSGLLPAGEFVTVSIGERNLINQNGIYVLSLDSGEAREVILAPPPVTRDTSLGIAVVIDYVDEDILVFHGYFGLFVYSFGPKEITLAVDLEKAVGTTIIQGSEGAAVRVSADGSTVQLYFYPERHEPRLAFYIDPHTGSYTYGEYAPLDSYSVRPDDSHSSIPGPPGGSPWTLEHLTYTDGDSSWLLFDNWDWDE